jgi:hypothetical protein
MAEIELSAFDRRLKENIPDDAALSVEVNALVEDRNNKHDTVNWQFFTEDARLKLKKYIHPYQVD